MIFGKAITFSVSGNFRPDFGIGLVLQKHKIRCSQFADAAARDFCLTIANHLDARTTKIRYRAGDRCYNCRPSRQNGTYWISLSINADSASANDSKVANLICGP